MRKFIFLLFVALFLGAPALKAEAAVPVSEQDFVDFLAMVLSDSSIERSRARVDSLVDSVSLDQREQDEVLDWAAKYLLDDRSPIYSPSAYDSLFVMDRVGRKAMDFNYVDTLGNRSSLYSSATVDTTVLFFYSADCDHCLALLSKWSRSSDLLPSILRCSHDSTPVDVHRCSHDSTSVKVLAICLNDDEDLWRKSISLLPAGWIPVRDSDGLIARRRYDLRRLPHLVALNRALKVVSVHTF